MDVSDLVNLLIVGAVIFGPMLAKMKMAKAKTGGLGQQGPVDAGTGLGRAAPRTPPTPVKPPTRIQPVEPTVVRTRKIMPDELAVEAKERDAAQAQTCPVPAVPCLPKAKACPRSHRRRWTRLQEAVVLREMLGRPVALGQDGGSADGRG